jgi:pyruvate formate lyase activating enzyme
LELTPWHVTRFYPQYQAADLPATPVSTLERALEIGRKAGLKFVYIGNVPGHDGENTTCYSCGKLIVRREGYSTKIFGLNGSKCKFCDAELNFRVWTKHSAISSQLQGEGWGLNAENCLLIAYKRRLIR